MFANLLQARRVAAYRQRFLANVDQNLFMGSFGSFAEAEAGVPSSKPVGYDNAASAGLYLPQIYSYDYPAMFWIARSMQQGMRSIFDLGGHIGVKYHAFKRAIDWPDDVRWKVCDVPTVVEAGRALAAQRRVEGQLSFCTDARDADGFDVLYASGSLQYLPTRIGALLASLPAKPRRIILNATATHPRRTIYTLNSIGVAVCPYRIQHHDELMTDVAEAGYRRLDGWRNDGKPIEVPFVEGGDEARYVGACWDLR